MRLAIIDPGKWRLGFAVFHYTTLVDVAELSSDHAVVGVAIAAVMRAPLDAVWVAEAPQTYRGHKSRDKDLETLRAVIRHVERLTGSVVVRYRPHAWKGNVPKEIHQARVMALLTSPERALVEALPRTRDALDAVGLGLVAVGRSRRGAA